MSELVQIGYDEKEGRGIFAVLRRENEEEHENEDVGWYACILWTDANGHETENDWDGPFATKEAAIQTMTDLQEAIDEFNRERQKEIDRGDYDY